jgi:hypothetical protein
MSTNQMTEEINQHRRRFIGTAAMTYAVAQLSLLGSAAAQSSKQRSTSLPAIKPGTNSPVRSMVPPSFCCTAGRTISIATLMSHHCWHQRATG